MNKENKEKKLWESLSLDEYKECLDLLNSWFEYPESSDQGHFARARWAVKKLGMSLGLETKR